MPRAITAIGLLLLGASFFSSGCMSYHRFRPTAVESAGIGARGNNTGDMSDAAVVGYADRTRDILRKRFHIARNVRQTAATGQILLAGAAGLAGAFEAGATTIAALAAGSAGIPQISEVFDTGNRAIAYQQAVAKISEAEDAYFKLRAGMHPVVPDNALTVEGALLLEAVNGATDAVELFQAGMLPTLEQMRRAEGLELRRRALVKEGRTADSGATETIIRTVKRTEPRSESPPQQPVAVATRREKLIARVRSLPQSNGASQILRELQRTPPATEVEARDQLASIVATANGPLLETIEESVAVPAPQDRTQKAREELVQQIKTLAFGDAAAVLAGMGKPVAGDDRQSRTKLKVLVSVADDAELAKIGTLVRNPPAPIGAPATPVGGGTASDRPVESTPPGTTLSTEEKMKLQERLVQDIKPLQLRGANEVLASLGQATQTDRNSALTKIKVAISNATETAALLKLEGLIKKALLNP